MIIKADHAGFQKPAVYESVTLQKELTITEIYSIRFLEGAKDFVLAEEEHNFWEFVYVAGGQAEVTVGTEVTVLQKGEILFHEPNEMHSLRAAGTSDVSVIAVSFACSAPCMDLLRKRKAVLDATERFYLSQIISEGKNAFSTSQNDLCCRKLQRCGYHSFGSEQMIGLSLEGMLLGLCRRFGADREGKRVENTAELKAEDTEQLRISSKSPGGGV